MCKSIITTSNLVSVLGELAVENPYVGLLRLNDDEALSLIKDLVHASLQDIFLSIEHMPEYDYEVLFARHVDKEEMFQIASRVDGFRYDVTECPRWSEEQQREVIVEVSSLPSCYEMCATAFDMLYNEFKDHIYVLLGGDSKVNSYANVVVKCTGNGSTITVSTTGDIRHDVYKELFKNGRYDPSRLQALRESGEDDSED